MIIKKVYSIEEARKVKRGLVMADIKANLWASGEWVDVSGNYVFLTYNPAKVLKVGKRWVTLYLSGDEYEVKAKPSDAESSISFVIN